jgi:hypothetical protein
MFRDATTEITRPAMRVRIDMKERTSVRINIRARVSQIEAINRMAIARGMTPSAYMVQSALRGWSGESSRKTAGRRLRCGRASDAWIDET